MNKAQFDTCLSSGAMARRVKQDKADGLALGVTRTPSFFIDGKRYEGAPSYDQFAKLLDTELASRGVAAPPTGTAAKQATDTGKSSKRAAGSAAPVPPPSVASAAPASPGGYLGGSPGGSMFSAGDNPLAGCSADEANQKQPALIDTAQAKRLFEDGTRTVFVDVRSEADFQKSRIRGALNIPLDKLEKRWARLPKDQPIVLYEGGRSANPDDICAASRAAGRFLISHGFSPERVKVYHDGLKAWEEAGLPVASGPNSGA
jgi:rhodanese-related sulfurtransferase